MENIINTAENEIRCNSLGTNREVVDGSCKPDIPRSA